MVNFPDDALPPSPASQDPLLQTEHDPLGLPGEDIEEMGLGASAHPLVIDCRSLEDEGLWQTDDCCSLCHDYAPVAPEPLRYGHLSVHGCCASHDALHHLDPPLDSILDRLFGKKKREK